MLPQLHICLQIFYLNTKLHTLIALTCASFFPDEIVDVGEILLHHFITISVASYLVLQKQQ